MISEWPKSRPAVTCEAGCERTGEKALQALDLKRAYESAREAERERAGTASPIGLVPRRRQILRQILLVRGRDDTPSRYVLFEYNRNKIDKAQTVFGKTMTVLEPHKLSLPFGNRVKLLALFGASNRRLSCSYLQCLAQALARKTVGDAIVYVFNPYHLLHLVPALAGLNVAVYFHNREIMMRQQDYFRDASRVVGSSFVLQYWGHPGTQLSVIQPDHSFRNPQQCVAFYFTNLALHKRLPTERRLGQFALWALQRSRNPIRVFLHYEDLESKEWRQRLDSLGLSALADHVIVPIAGRSSLHELSRQQISFSAASSIGGELIALGIEHFLLDDVQGTSFADIASSAGVELKSEGS